MNIVQEIPVSSLGKQEGHSFTHYGHNPSNIRYLLYLPRDYDPTQKWPLILSLHGASLRGDDLERIKYQGLQRTIARGAHYPFIIVSPQCPTDLWWPPEMLDALLNEIERVYPIDADRIYVTGLSMGGFGTWDLAIKYPHRFAAIAPMCGGGKPNKVSAISHLPVWVFHGDRDFIVPISRSQEMVNALKACDADVRFTVYRGVGHDCWLQAYDTPELYDWFLSHRRK